MDDLDIKFKVEDKIDFITRDTIKDDFIEQINLQQRIIDQYEKDRVRL